MFVTFVVGRMIATA